MKTYEEMARDVLKRRDEELQKMQSSQKTNNYTMFNAPPEVVYPAAPKKLGLLPKIAIPCTAAVLVGAVGLTVWRNSPYRGDYKGNTVVSGDAENELANLAVGVADIAQETNSVVGSITPAAARETKIKILNREYHIDTSQDVAPVIDEHCKFEALTFDELNKMYGIEFNKLGRLHGDWNESYDRLGRVAREMPGITTESYAATGSREVLSTCNTLKYETPNGATVDVSAELGTIPDLSYFELSEDDYSVLNGYRALVMRANYEGRTLYGAAIQMDRAFVQISVDGLSEEEFKQVLCEYTGAVVSNEERNGEQDIIIHDTMPEKFKEINPFSVLVCGNLFDDLTFEPYADAKCIGYFYGIDFDRLTRLHSDWNEGHGDFGIYSRTTDDGYAVSYKIVWTRNRISYELPNGAVLNVEAERGNLIDLISDITLDIAAYSTINGFPAMIYRDGDVSAGEVYDDKEYPNNGAKFGAVIQMGKAVVHISSAGLSEEEFLNVLSEYTVAQASNDTDNDIKPIAVEPTFEATTSFTAVNVVSEKMYTLKLNENNILFGINRDEFGSYTTQGSIMTQEGEVALGYISEFFGNDIFPVDKTYKDNLVLNVHDGNFTCEVLPQTKLISPVDGKVIAVNDMSVAYGNWVYWGNAVAVEFGDGKIFIATHLEEVHVSAGDTVTAGQTLGLCGNTGRTAGYQLGLFLLKKAN